MNILSNKAVWLLKQIGDNDRMILPEDIEDGMYDDKQFREGYALGFRDGLLDLAKELLRDLELSNANKRAQAAE